jgi:conjugative relaxase-like TrwC/TraI family protein
MIGIHIHKDARKAAAYHEDHLVADSAAGEYYAQEGQTVGKWFGKGAELLGLQGGVTKEQFERVCSNQYPATGNQLTPRRKEDARSAYDFCISAPKSLSILALALDDQRIIEAHKAAVAETLKEAQALALVRVRKAGACADRPTGVITAATFEHFSGRENDPQLHTHCLIFNSTFDQEEKQWKALQAVELYKQSGLLTEVYRNRLVACLNECGYHTRTTKEAFEIEGVSRDIINTFSKRHHQIDEAAEALGAAGNKSLRASIAHKSRKTKDTSLSMTQLRESWLAQPSPEQVAELRAVKAAAVHPVQPAGTVSAGQALDLAALHLFERRSVVTEHALVEEALAVSRGQHDLQAISLALQSNPGFVVQNKQVTTAAAIATETAMLDFVKQDTGKLAPLNEGFATGPDLSDEQNTALKTLLSCRDRVTILDGPAGTGKTTTLKELVSGLKAADHDVVMCAPTASATDLLRQDGFVGALTLQRLLTDKQRHQELDHSTILLDEAGLVSVAQMNALFSLAAAHDCRIILSGDSRQHKSVEAGDALRVLEEHGGLQRAQLHTIRRQTHDDYKRAVEAIKNGRHDEGFSTLDGLGWVKELDDDERYQQLAADFRDSIRDGQSCLTVCATWRESIAATSCIRDSMRNAGMLTAKESPVTVLDPLHFTQAHRQQLHHFEAGQVVVFTHKTDLFPRGEHLTVTGVASGHVNVSNGEGEVFPLDPAKLASKFSVFTPRKISLAAGDQILIRANGRSLDQKKVINGELVLVKDVLANGDIKLKDGRTLPASFQHFTHGYAVTSQSAQGKTVDNVFLAIDALSALTAATLETFYVGVTRGRKRCTIYTDAKDMLGHAFGRSAERMAALEFLKASPPTPTTNENNQPPTTCNTNSTGRPVPATGLALHPEGHDHADCGQIARSGIDARQRAQRSDQRGRDHQDKVQKPLPVCPPAQTWWQLPLFEVERAGY